MFLLVFIFILTHFPSSFRCVKGCFDEKRGGIFCGKWDGTIKSLDVGRSDSAEISIDVLSGQIVRYEFETEYYDISFGVFFQQADSSEKSLVIDNAKVFVLFCFVLFLVFVLFCFVFVLFCFVSLFWCYVDVFLL